MTYHGIRLADQEDCTGCGACANACPVHCITMDADREGFSYPVIHEDGCTFCGRCTEICQAACRISGEEVGAVSFNLAADFDTQKKSASGGVFYVLARQFIECGGYVAGAVWGDDGKVHHIVSNRLSDLERMRRSKYIQSEAGTVYSDAERLLMGGHIVLFSGTSCQIAGLKAYLQKDYEKLLCIGIICHGVASGKLLNAHIRKLTDEEVIQIDFRNRDKIGTGQGLYVRCKSGREIVGRGLMEDSFIYQYCMGMTYRRCCYHCRFRNNYPSDILIGDAGQIQHHVLKNELMERSVVFALNEKGRRVVFDHLKEFRFIGHSTVEEVIDGYNQSLIQSETENRMLRDQLYQSTLLTNEIPHFDVLLVALWGPNYGTHMTNFALYKAIENLGLSVVALSHHTGNEIPAYCGGYLPEGNRDFLAENMELSYRYMEAADMREIADTVILGSDILWNEYIMRDYASFQVYSLAWWGQNVWKLSYGVSIGTRDGFPQSRKKLFAEALKDFSAISLRERSGVEWVEKTFHRKAEHVLDPVFLLKKEDYQRICRLPERKKEKPQLLVYLLNPNDEWAEYIHRLEEKSGKKITIIVGWEYLVRHKWEMSWYDLDYLTTPLLKIPEWLWYFANAEYILTDSWHGACFGVIFEKKLLAFTRAMGERFETLSDIEELSEHFAPQSIGVEEDLKLLCKTIDYEKVNMALQLEIRRSKNWLEKSLQKTR